MSNWVKKSEFLEAMEALAPRALAEDWDNVGMLIDCGKSEYRRIHVALELTEAVAKEAAERKADLLVTHHPVMLGGIKRLDGTDAESRAMLMLMQNGISLFAAHTNFDAAQRGTNAFVAEALGLKNLQPLEPPRQDGFSEASGLWGMGRVGDLAAPCTLSEFAKTVKTALGLSAIRAAGDPEKLVRRAAVCTGAGGSLAEAALSAGADVLVTGDVRHHNAAEAVGRGLALLDAGHFETEAPAMQWLIDGLQDRLNRVEYNTEFYLSQAQEPVLVTL